MYRLSKCTSEDGPPSSNAFSHYFPTPDPLRFQRSNAPPNAPPTAKHFLRFSQRFKPFSQGFRFSIVLLDSSMALFNLSAVLIYSSIVFFNFAGFARFYSYITAVCLPLTQMHLPQSPPLHPLNRFAPFFHCFISVLPPHIRHTSKITIFPLLFHRFTRALRDNGPTSAPQFFHCVSMPSISVILLFYFIWYHFGPTSQAQFFHCFSIF